MAREEFAKAAKYWKHWVVYFTLTFLSIFVFTEFALSLSFISILSPSTLMFYFTPVGFFMGEALVSFFATAILFVGLFIVLRQKVYVKESDSLKFNRSDSHLLLPFYLVPLASLGVYISLIPLQMSNILTYAVFLLLFESFVEHVQVSDYKLEREIDLKIVESFKSVLPSRNKKTADPEQIQKTLEELERITEVHEERQREESEISKTKISDPEVKEMVEDLMEIVEDGEEEDTEEEAEEEATIVKECENCGTAVVEDVKTCPDCGASFEEEEKEVSKEKAIMDLTSIEGIGITRAEKLYENGLYTAEDIVEEGITGLSGIRHIGIQTAKKILAAAEERVKKKKEMDDELTQELEDLEEELLDEE